MLEALYHLIHNDNTECSLFSTGGGPDGDGKDDLDSGDEADGKKIDTEEVS